MGLEEYTGLGGKLENKIPSILGNQLPKDVCAMAKHTSSYPQPSPYPLPGPYPSLVHTLHLVHTHHLVHTLHMLSCVEGGSLS